jgi:hypothetical protein
MGSARVRNRSAGDGGHWLAWRSGAALKITRYRPAFFTGFDREDDVVDPWDEKLTADSNAHWFKDWLERGSKLTLERQQPGKFFKPRNGEPTLQHYVMSEHPDGKRWVCALAHEPAPADWKWLE